MKKEAKNQIEDAIQILENALAKLKDLKDAKTEVNLVRTRFEILTYVRKKGANNNMDKYNKEITVTYGTGSCIHIDHTIGEDDIDEQEGGEQ